MNYRQIYARKAECEKRIKEVCPQCPNRPGIYAFYRTDPDTHIRFAYIGQARSLISRIAQHLQEYDHLALSLKKRGIYNKEKNPHGWMIRYIECSLEDLDKKETEFIKQWADAGFQLLNKTGGSQSDGKVVFDNKKPSRGYFDGVDQGEKNARRFIADLFAKHLTVSTKRTPPTVNQQKALEKFKKFCDWEAE